MNGHPAIFIVSIFQLAAAGPASGEITARDDRIYSSDDLLHWERGAPVHRQHPDPCRNVT